MNVVEHLLTCLAEEGGEVTQDACKSLRFGLDDRNILDPVGPTNRERLIVEVNQLIAVMNMLAEQGVIPRNWVNPDLMIEKKEKVHNFMNYARKVGTLHD